MAQIGQIYYRIPSNSGYLTTSVGSNAIDPYNDVLTQIGASQFTKVGIQAPPGTQMVLNQIKQIMIGRTGIYELDEDIAVTELYFIRPQNYIRDEEAERTAMEAGLSGIQKAMEDKEARYLSETNNYAASWTETLSQIAEYTALLEQEKDLLAAKEAELVELQSELAALTPGTSEYQSKQLEVTAKEAEITQVNINIQNYETRLTGLRGCTVSDMQGIEDEYLVAYTEARAEYYKGANGIYKPGELGDLENIIIDYMWE